MQRLQPWLEVLGALYQIALDLASLHFLYCQNVKIMTLTVHNTY